MQLLRSNMLLFIKFNLKNCFYKLSGVTNTQERLNKTVEFLKEIQKERNANK